MTNIKINEDRKEETYRSVIFEMRDGTKHTMNFVRPLNKEKIEDISKDYTTKNIIYTAPQEEEEYIHGTIWGSVPKRYVDCVTEKIQKLEERIDKAVEFLQNHMKDRSAIKIEFNGSTVEIPFEKSPDWEETITGASLESELIKLRRWVGGYIDNHEVMVNISNLQERIDKLESNPLNKRFDRRRIK